MSDKRRLVLGKLTRSCRNCWQPDLPVGDLGSGGIKAVLVGTKSWDRDTRTASRRLSVLSTSWGFSLCRSYSQD